MQISAAQLSAGFTDNQNLAEATVENTDPSLICVIGNPENRGNTAWYGLTTGATESYLKASAGAGFSSVMVVVTGTPGNFQFVVGGCNHTGAAKFGSELDGLKLAANTNYSIMIARPSQSTDNSTVAFAAGLATIKRVTKTADTNDGDCSAGDCSLREAIQTANGGAIELPAGDYALTIAGNSEDLGNTGDLDIGKGLFIYGAGAATTTISTTPGDRLIDIDPLNDLLGPTVGLFNLTLRGGGGENFFDSGGCINTARFSGSGGPANEFLVLSNVVLTNCKSRLGGGAISSQSAPMHIYQSVIKNNYSATGGGGVDYGPFSGGSPGQALIERSTISGNESGSSGGGIQSRGSLVLVASTVSGNRTINVGGGIYVYTFNGRVTIVDSTIANNVAAGGGGGILFGQPTMSTTAYQILSSVFADNRVGDGTVQGDCHSGAFTVISANRSWFQSPHSTCAIIALGNVGNTVNQAAMLGALANNGGSTETHAPLVGSPLIDNVNATSCLSTDQRGIARPKDGDGNGSNVCDIGAVEVIFTPPGIIFADGFEDLAR